ncbi:TIGR03086 family metal-binding protein [Rhodococcus sp. NPDC003318]|uniref:TIGR03086 family metal-binding protein n=1 Tax=Rhodococcus sp. NPDC003318 TaxID=3364503 RepID=UPI0036876B08
MTADRVARPLADPVALLGSAVRYTDAALGLVTAEDLSRPTPCSEWNLRQLLSHMDESLTVLEEAVLDRAVVLHPVAVPAGSVDPVGVLRNRACRMVRSWVSAGDRGAIRVGDAPLPSDVAAAAGALEVAVHGWDVARTLGPAAPIPPGLARELLFCAGIFVTDADRPARFGAARPVAAGAGPHERLLAFLGR